MQVFFVLTTGIRLTPDVFMGKSIFIRYQTIKTKYETMIHIGEKPLIFTIDNLSENTIVSISSAAEFSPRICIGLPAISPRCLPANGKLFQPA